MTKPKVLILDIETAPLISWTWGIWEQNIGLNQIKSDWHVLSWAAKWLGTPPSCVLYEDQRHAKNVQDDSKLLSGMWALLDEADIIITQNGKSFDAKKLNARFIMNGMQPPSSYKHIDTKRLASKHFAFTSNKLEYLTDKLCKKYKKLKTKKYVGFDLWKACLAGDVRAWNEMEKYNKYDVLSLEELYYKLAPWDNTVKFGPYTDELQKRCNCGSNVFKLNGYRYTAVGKYQRFKCTACGCESQGRVNLMSKMKRAAL